ncbi:hypothetical protein [Streptomyces sp. NPDC007264]|uniref:hypothetical protein n=1 Tax=Streptomyces sp. NPDC007264 TaxID=3364777 RepID=UPI0036DEC552
MTTCARCTTPTDRPLPWNNGRFLCPECFGYLSYELGFRDAAQRAGLAWKPLALGSLVPAADVEHDQLAAVIPLHQCTKRHQRAQQRR